MAGTFDITALFEKAKRVYAHPPGSFYVSTTTLYGMHLAVYPEGSQAFFSEYTIGNPKDAAKIAALALQENVFKSFYCGICTIGEEDNYSTLTKPCMASAPDTSRELKRKQNLSTRIQTRVSFGGIPFLISGTVPQYYYNHLLLSTVSHYSTYMVFEYKNLFDAVMVLSGELARQDPKTNIVFNGTFGSDRWHFHTHLTNQTLGYVDYAISKVTDVSNRDLNKSFGVVQFKLLGSTDLATLFAAANAYTAILYQRDFYSRLKYLSAVFRTIGISGVNYHIVLLLIGNNIRNFTVGDLAFSAILPAAIINVGSAIITKPIARALATEIAAKGCYIDWRTVPIVTRDTSLPVVENFERKYAFRPDTCAIDFFKLADVAKIYADVERCRKTSTPCDESMVAVYKYIISLSFVCAVVNDKKKRGGTIAASARRTYKALLKNPAFRDQAITAGIVYLTDTYRIQDTSSLFLKGSFAGDVFASTIRSLMVLSSGDHTVVPGGDHLQLQTKQINDWLDYTKRFIGERSAKGAVVSSSLKGRPQIEFVIKINRVSGTTLDTAIFFNEFAAGMKINALRDHTPNFMLTLGGFECISDRDFDSLCYAPPDREAENSYIILERIQGASFARYVGAPTTTPLQIVLALQQIYLALLYGQNTIDLTLYDLHSENVLVTDLPEPVVYRYRIGQNTYSVLTYVNATIIDYGGAHVKGLADYPTDPYLTHRYGMTPALFQPHRDAYTIIIHTFLMFLAQRSATDITSLYNDPSPLKSIIMEMFATYRDIFVPNPFDTIMRGYAAHVSALTIAPSRDDKIKTLVSIFNSARIDSKYYLYLPERYGPPSAGEFRSQVHLVRYVDSLIGAAPTNLPTYQWGDYDEIGCLSMKTVKDGSLQIAAIRSAIAAP